MSKTVLDVGNCGPDHAAIKRMLTSQFDVKVLQADELADTLLKLDEESIDLVLVNRKLDCDYSDGLEIIKHIKATPELADAPCMLVSNHENHQQEAAAAGALPGFGKLQFEDSRTKERLAAVLG
jgi:response regulator RpfG family c-di-GMP phosphodiesterase